MNIRFVAIATLSAFIYSFVLYEPLMGINTLVSENKNATIAENKPDGLRLPYRLGRIVSDSRPPVPGDSGRLIVYIQDLHCNPEVQKNICDIIKFFDDKYNVNRIFVEGAPNGKVDTGLLSSIHGEETKKKVLDGLLSKGLISGAEYYAVSNNADKLYGIENWELYNKNLSCIRELIKEKDKNLKVVAELKLKLDSIKGKYLSFGIKRLEKTLAGSNKYAQFDKLSKNFNEDISGYPNLNKYLEITKLNREINYKRLPEELHKYVSELKKIIPYSAYQALIAKLDNGGSQEEYYYSLHETAKIYTPRYGSNYPNLEKFLRYVNLNCSINPVYLVAEENGFTGRILRKTADNMLDKEVLLLSEMIKIFEGFAGLEITPDDFKYFKDNKEIFAALLQKYLPEKKDNQLTASAIALLSEERHLDFFEANLLRNNIFVQNIVSAEPGRQLSGPNIDIIVAGGFHGEITKILKDKNIAFLAITPNISQLFDNKLYERVISGKLKASDIQSSALAPALINLLKGTGLNESSADAELWVLVISIAQAERGNKSLEDIYKEISGWIEANGLDKYGAKIKYDGATITINLNTEKWEITRDRNKKLNVRKTDEIKENTPPKSSLSILKSEDGFLESFIVISLFLSVISYGSGIGMKALKYLKKRINKLDLRYGFTATGKISKLISKYETAGEGEKIELINKITTLLNNNPSPRFAMAGYRKYRSFVLNILRKKYNIDENLENILEFIEQDPVYTVKELIENTQSLKNAYRPFYIQAVLAGAENLEKSSNRDKFVSALQDYQRLIQNAESRSLLNDLSFVDMDELQILSDKDGFKANIYETIREEDKEVIKTVINKMIGIFDQNLPYVYSSWRDIVTDTNSKFIHIEGDINNPNIFLEFMLHYLTESRLIEFKYDKNKKELEVYPVIEGNENPVRLGKISLNKFIPKEYGLSLEHYYVNLFLMNIYRPITSQRSFTIHPVNRAEPDLMEILLPAFILSTLYALHLMGVRMDTAGYAAAPFIAAGLANSKKEAVIRTSDIVELAAENPETALQYLNGYVLKLNVDERVTLLHSILSEIKRFVRTKKYEELILLKENLLKLSDDVADKIAELDNRFYSKSRQQDNGYHGSEYIEDSGILNLNSRELDDGYTAERHTDAHGYWIPQSIITSLKRLYRPGNKKPPAGFLSIQWVCIAALLTLAALGLSSHDLSVSSIPYIGAGVFGIIAFPGKSTLQDNLMSYQYLYEDILFNASSIESGYNDDEIYINPAVIQLKPKNKPFDLFCKALFPLPATLVIGFAAGIITAGIILYRLNPDIKLILKSVINSVLSSLKETAGNISLGISHEDSGLPAQFPQISGKLNFLIATDLSENEINALVEEKIDLGLKTVVLRPYSEAIVDNTWTQAKINLGAQTAYLFYRLSETETGERLDIAVKRPLIARTIQALADDLNDGNGQGGGIYKKKYFADLGFGLPVWAYEIKSTDNELIQELNSITAANPVMRRAVVNGFWDKYDNAKDNMTELAQKYLLKPGIFDKAGRDDKKEREAQYTKLSVSIPDADDINELASTESMTDIERLAGQLGRSGVIRLILGKSAKGLEEKAVKANKCGVNIIKNLGREENINNIIDNLPDKKSKVSGICFDIRNMEINEYLQFLDKLKLEVQKAKVYGNVSSDAVIMIEGTHIMAPAIRASGFEAVETASSAEEIERFSKEDSAVYINPVEQGRGLTEVLLKSGAGHAIMELGKMKNGIIYDFPLNIDPSKDFSLNDLLDMIERLIPLSEVRTPRALMETGIIKGRKIIESAKPGQAALDKLIKSLFELKTGEKFNKLWTLLDILDNAGDDQQSEAAAAQIKEMLISAKINFVVDVKGLSKYEIRGLISGIIGACYRKKMGLDLKDNEIDSFDKMVVLLTKGIGYENGQPVLLSENGYEGKLKAMPGRLSLFSHEEKLEIIKNLGIEAGNETLNKLKLINAVYQSLDSRVEEDNKILKKYLISAMPFADIRYPENLTDTELIYWLNYGEIYSKTMNSRKYKYEALNDLIENCKNELVKRTNDSELRAKDITMNILPLAMGELLNTAELKNILGSTLKQQRFINEAINENRSFTSSEIVMATRAILRQDEVTQEKYEAHMNMLISSITQNDTNPDSASSAFKIFLERIIDRESELKNLAKKKAVEVLIPTFIEALRKAG